MIDKPIIYKFYKDFTNHVHRKKSNRTIFFSCRPFPNILKYRDHQRDLSTIWKTRHLQTHTEKFRTTAGIKAGPDAFDESTFVMTFLIILEVTEILSSFRLALEGKIG